MYIILVYVIGGVCGVAGGGGGVGCVGGWWGGGEGGGGGGGGGVPRVSKRGQEGGGLTGEKGSNRFRLGGIRGWEVLGNMIGWGRV